MTEDTVSDSEDLYRSVRGELSDDEYGYDDYNGRLIIKPKAFHDTKKEPSVDRAKLRNFNPQLSKLNETDGIVTLVAGEVRGIGDVVTNIEEGSIVRHAVDVKPDRKDYNEAHALIVVSPEFFGSKTKQKNVFKLLRISLARLATKRGWTISPSSLS